MKTREEVSTFVRRKAEESFDSFLDSSREKADARRYLVWEGIRILIEDDELPVVAIKYVKSRQIKADLDFLEQQEHEQPAGKLNCIIVEIKELIKFLEFLDED